VRRSMYESSATWALSRLYLAIVHPMESFPSVSDVRQFNYVKILDLRLLRFMNWNGPRRRAGSAQLGQSGRK
jgi:hypothetical protein